MPVNSQILILRIETAIVKFAIYEALKNNALYGIINAMPGCIKLEE